MAVPMSVEDKFALITRHLQEHTKDDILLKVLAERDARIYWGTATTGKPHLAYFVPMSKISDFLRAGCEVTILLADVHAFLDNLKAPWELLELRIKYYSEVITAMLEAIGVPVDKLRFVVGSTFQLDKDFTLDALKLASLCSQHDAQRAGAEVVKQSESPPLSGLLYPLYQWLDEQYLDCDAQFGGVDQRKIFMGAEKYLPRLGYKVRSHLMNKMVPGLTGEKMSSSEVDSKIDLLDSPAQVKKKIKKVFCEQGNIEKNPLLEWIKSVIFLIRSDFPLLVRDQEPKIFTEYQPLEDAFAAGEIHPADLKASMVAVLNELLAPIRAKFDTPEMQDLSNRAYPAPKAAKKQKADQAPKPMDPSRLDLRVGKIVSVETVPESDKLFLEQIDCGDASGPRTVVSGLVGKVEKADLEGRLVVMLCNLPKAKLCGIVSHAMVMCASCEDGVEPLSVPEGAQPGDRIVCEGFEAGAPDKELKSKQKVWATLSPDLAVGDDNVARWKDARMVVQGKEGFVSTKTIAGVPIK
eukprot:m.355494 g.355494  ORF g.355494 m.355494 type:complete len:523 (-) comp17264_c0_seq1:499-2067(-)